MDDNNNYLQDDQLDRQAKAWYDQTDDAQPYDAFGSSVRKTEIGNEIYDRIQRNIIYRRNRSFLPLKIAAAVLALIISTMMVYRHFQHPVVPATPTWTTISSGENEVKNVILPDSSVIRLQGNSTIRYATAFLAGTARHVTLEEGAAFFDVHRDASRPFTVYTKSFRIKVLGTSFNISAYSDRPDFKIDVVSGKIRVEQDGPSGTKILAKEMAQDQCLTVDLASADYKIVQHTNVVNSKIKPVSTIRHLTLQQIAGVLGDKYNLFVQLNNPDNDTSTYVVDLGQRSLEGTLKTLTEQTSFSYTIVNGQHLIIQPKTAGHME